MRPHQQKLAFIQAFIQAFPDTPREECVRAAGELLRLAKRRHTLALAQCRGAGVDERIPYPRAGVLIEEWEDKIGRRLARLLARIDAECGLFKLPYESKGDPRGYVLKVQLPGGAWVGVPV